MLADLDQPMFKDDDAARAYLESVHWPDGPICPHCGERERVTRLHGKAHRAGVVQCNNCREQFTVTIGTVMERSKIPLHKWVLAMHLLCASKKGMSAHQLHRMLGVTYQTAWFLAHRLRAAMADPNAGPLGGEGATVEADETYYGEKDDPAKRRKPGQRGPAGKRPVVGLVERGGKVRTFHVGAANKEVVEKIVRENINRETALMTDESSLYPKVGTEFASHETVCHSAGEYVRGEVHTNTMDGYWGLFKRGMRGIYQHCGEQHLHRYLSEFDFRYNSRTRLGFSDRQRTDLLAAGIAGKDLTYRRPSHATYV
jgi:transposase-like protein